MRYTFLLIAFFISIPKVSRYAQVINAGVGGNTSGDLLVRIDQDVLSHDPDLVILIVGTNDMLNSRKMISYLEYKNNLDSLIQKIKARGSELVLMSSPPVDSAYLFTRHDKKLYIEEPNQKMDSIRKIVMELATAHQVYFFDLNTEFKLLNLPQHNQDLFIRNVRNSGKADGVHPTSLGYCFIAESVYQFLKEKYLLKPGWKIICFGDSITRGGGSKNNNNYPSYLSQLVHE